MTERLKTLLVDGNSLFKNSFEPTYKSLPDFGGIYTFLNKIRYILDNDNYNRLRIVFDGNEKGILRRLVYPSYKENRLQANNIQLSQLELDKKEAFNMQKSILKDYLTHFAYFYEDKVVEADDIIAKYIELAQPNELITIVTGDVDLMALISEKVDVFYLNKTFKNKTKTVQKYEKDENRKNLVINHKNFHKYFGYTHKNIPIIKTICGDTSDCIKNVKGVKEKTLFKHIPKITQHYLDIPRLLDECKIELLSEDINETKEKFLLNILGDKQKGHKILELNHRVISLENKEFITTNCIENLKKSGFLSTNKYKPIDNVGLVRKLQTNGLQEHIVKYHKSLHYFFKPFKKTFIE